MRQEASSGSEARTKTRSGVPRSRGRCGKIAGAGAEVFGKTPAAALGGERRVGRDQSFSVLPSYLTVPVDWFI